MSNIDKAIEILAATNDGDDLSPEHLYLVQCGVNGRLSEEGNKALDNLLDEVRSGRYNKPTSVD